MIARGVRISLMAAGLLVFLVGLNFAQTQANERVLQWPATPIGRATAAANITLADVQEALEITSVTVADQSITIGQPFPAGDDWLRGLSFKVKNISGRPIIGARLHFGLLETAVGNSGLGFSLEYGRGLSTGIPSDEQKLIMPSEEFELKFNEAQYRRHREFVTERTSLKSFTKVGISHLIVKFDDGSIWSSDCLRSNNPANSCIKSAVNR